MEIWMKPPGSFPGPITSVFRNCFETERNDVLKFEFSADEFATVFLDGNVIARGPERGSSSYWYRSAAIAIPVASGKHILTARVNRLGSPLRPYGQMSIRHGFFCHEYSNVLAQHWEARFETDADYVNPRAFWGSCAQIHCGKNFPYEAWAGAGDGWQRVDTFEDDRILHAPALPDMRQDEVTSYHRKGNVFLFDEYVCVWGAYRFSGPGTIKLRWGEPGCSPEDFTPEFLNGKKPGEGPFLLGDGDVFDLPEAKEVRFFDLHWKAGRLLEVRCDGEARLLSAEFVRTGYPYHYDVNFRAPGDQATEKLLAMSRSTLEACSHDTFMDCPYYEQLQYVSDCRVEALSSYVICSDKRLIEKAILLFALSIKPDGMLPCRYPVDDDPAYVPAFGDRCKPSIPSFMCYYIALVHDYALWGGKTELIHEVLPVLRKIERYLRQYEDNRKLLFVPGWNFLDWMPNWNAGVPPGGETGGGCSLNWIWVQALRDLADLETLCGEVTNAPEYMAHADAIAASVKQVYFRPEEQFYSEDETHAYASEHAQVLALLTEKDTRVLPALRSGILDECGIYFSLYSLEAFRLFKETELFASRKQKYLDIARTNLVTMPECFPNTWWQRSDCHAWSSHFLYHHYREFSFIERLK